jgi:hypothetical protein
MSLVGKYVYQDSRTQSPTLPLRVLIDREAMGRGSDYWNMTGSLVVLNFSDRAWKGHI